MASLVSGAARNGPRLLGALLVELALCFAQPCPAAPAGAQLRGQLVAARVAVELVFGGIYGLGFFDPRQSAEAVLTPRLRNACVALR